MARVLGRKSPPLDRRHAGWRPTHHPPLRATDPLGISSASPELALPRGPNATWEEDWRGRFSTSGGEAVVRIGPRSARMDLPAGRKSPLEALRATAFLPGNVRFAGPPHRLSLRADSWLRTDSLAASVDEFRLGVRRVRPRRRPLRTPVGRGRERFEALLGELDRDDATVDLVPLDSGWELGARIRGGRVPVRVSPESKGLRLHRIVVEGESLGDAGTTAAVCDVAVRRNASIRFARFAIHERGLAVEARLSCVHLDPPRLVESVHAVAAVSRELGPTLQVLCRHPGVADCYARIFHSNHREHAS